MTITIAISEEVWQEINKRKNKEARTHDSVLRKVLKVKENAK